MTSTGSPPPPIPAATRSPTATTRLDRKRVVWEGQVLGPIRAEWGYDTIAKSYLDYSIRTVGTSTCQTSVVGYTDDYQPTGTQTVIPTSETGLSGVYNVEYTYNDIDGLLFSQTFAGPNGDLPTETLPYGYDSLGQPTTLNTVLPPAPTLSIPRTVETRFGGFTSPGLGHQSIIFDG